MLDVGFSEILLTSAIALIVLGPERLPKVARQVGNWMGRARAMARQLSEQLEREVSAEEFLKSQKKSTQADDSAASPNPGGAVIAAPTPAAAPEVQGGEQTMAPGVRADAPGMPADAPAESRAAREPVYGLPADATTAAAMHANDPLADPKPPHE
jgi:sec-independent protein translocase protein TatB